MPTLKFSDSPIPFHALIHAPILNHRYLFLFTLLTLLKKNLAFQHLRKTIKPWLFNSPDRSVPAQRDSRYVSTTACQFWDGFPMTRGITGSADSSGESWSTYYVVNGLGEMGCGKRFGRGFEFGWGEIANTRVTHITKGKY